MRVVGGASCAGDGGEQVSVRVDGREKRGVRRRAIEDGLGEERALDEKPRDPRFVPPCLRGFELSVQCRNASRLVDLHRRIIAIAACATMRREGRMAMLT